MSNLFTPTDRAVIAREAAKMLLEIKAVHFYSDKPFVFTSGWASPVYIDCRKIISYPRLRSTLIDFAATTIVRDIGYESLDIIAGGETAGIPFAAWISDRLSLPMQYVRKKPKGFGRNALIEGDFAAGQRTLLVEDLATDGGSKLKFVEGMRQAGMTVDHAFVVFFYDIFPNTRTLLGEAGIALHYLATWWDVLKIARADKIFDTATLDEVERFLHGPAEWSTAHGGIVP